MTQQRDQLIKLKSLAKVIAVCTSLSLGVILILQAQQDAGYVVAQDRPQAQQTSQANTTLKTSPKDKKDDASLKLFYDRDDPGLIFADANYIVELVKDPSPTDPDQKPDQEIKLKVTKPNPNQIRNLTSRAVKRLSQRLKELKTNPKAYQLTTKEVNALRDFNKRLESNQEISRSHFAPTSKALGPSRRPTPPVPLNVTTLAALKKILGLTR